MNRFSNSPMASSNRIPRSTICVTSPSNWSFTMYAPLAGIFLRAGLLGQFLADQDAVGLPIFGTSCCDYIGGQFGARRGFGPPDPFQIVANKLFVERWLRA